MSNRNHHRVWKTAALAILLGGCFHGTGAPAEEGFDRAWRDYLRGDIPAAAGLGASFEAARAAGGVIPFLKSYGGFDWPGRISGGPLEAYLDAPRGAGYASWGEYVSWRLDGKPAAGLLPEDVVRNLLRMSEAAAGAVAALRQCPGCRTDLNALALLGRYHARRVAGAAALALFDATGDLSALRMAMSETAAATSVWERLITSVDTPGILFGTAEVDSCRREAQFLRRDSLWLAAAERVLQRYGLFDLGLEFGAAGRAGAGRRFRGLHPAAVYSTGSGFGWLGAAPVRASQPAPDAPPFRTWLRGHGTATLVADLADGDYRVTCVVTNQPELAAGSFELRAGPSSIRYGSGETGEKSMHVRVSGNRLEVAFVPGSGGDWLVSGLIITRRAPHIGWVPPRVAAAAAPLYVAPTVTAPDGVARVELHCEAGTGNPVTVPLRPDGLQFTARVEWPRSWASLRPRCRVVATDSRGSTSTAP